MFATQKEASGYLKHSLAVLKRAYGTKVVEHRSRFVLAPTTDRIRLNVEKTDIDFYIAVAIYGDVKLEAVVEILTRDSLLLAIPQLIGGEEIDNAFAIIGPRL